MKYPGDTDIVWDKKDNLIWRGIRVRMGIHTGRPLCERDPVTGRMDYFGPVVNRAARISSKAQGGEIVFNNKTMLEVAGEGKWLETDEGPAPTRSLCANPALMGGPVWCH